METGNSKPVLKCRNSLYIFLLLLFAPLLALGQEVDKDLIIGKWKFVKATRGPQQQVYQYNGDPILAFEKNGSWITEDINPHYRQSGSWEIKNNILIRDPETAGSGDMQPYPRVIEKLTRTELVFYASPGKGPRAFTFYFERIE